jgi:DNA-binding MarR family transcriptional regulator/GNAT superfamily N-acetyltransferase
VRQFNRFYTQKIGVLGDRLLRSPFSLAQMRVLYELANRQRPTAKDLSRDLGLDAGYLSRILAGFQKAGYLAKEVSAEDRRVTHLGLTRKGADTFAPLNRRSQEEVGNLLGPLSEGQQQRLVQALRTVQTLLGGMDRARPPYLLRPHQPGDMGWVIGRHGALYAQEYGWNGQFEALVAEIAAAFLKNFDSTGERCWIAERDGEQVGSVFVVRQSKTVAKLRLLIVEPSARGLGIGARLVEECIRFSRASGYRKLILWTNSILIAARRIYEAQGFQLTASEPHHSFGQDLVGETWELKL